MKTLIHPHSYLLFMLAATMGQPAWAQPSKEQAANFIKQNKADIGAWLGKGPGQKVLNSNIDLLFIDDRASRNQYLTSMNSSGRPLLGSQPATMFGAKRLTPGTKRLATWYPHGPDEAIESITAVQPVAAFRGLSDRRGNQLGGARTIRLPNGDYVNPMLSAAAFDYLSEGALGAERRLSVYETMKSGNRRLVSAKVRKQAQLLLNAPGVQRCSALKQEGVAGQLCVLRETEGTGFAIASPDLRFSIKGEQAVREVRFRVGEQWHAVNEPISLAAFKGTSRIEVFIPATLNVAPTLARLKLSFFSPGRSAMGDSYQTSAAMGTLLTGERISLISRTQFAYIADQVAGDQYVLSQSGRNLGKQQLLAPALVGHKGATGALPARWRLSDTVPARSSATLEPAALFKGQDGDPLFSAQGWQWFANGKLGESRLLRYNDGVNRVSTQAKKGSQLLLSQGRGCHAETLNGHSGTACILRTLASQLQGSGGDIRFTLTEPQGASHYRIGEGEWRAVARSSPFTAFAGAKQLALFFPKAGPTPLAKVRFAFTSEGLAASRSTVIIASGVTPGSEQGDWVYLPRDGGPFVMWSTEWEAAGGAFVAQGNPSIFDGPVSISVSPGSAGYQDMERIIYSTTCGSGGYNGSFPPGQWSGSITPTEYKGCILVGVLGKGDSQPEPQETLSIRATYAGSSATTYSYYPCNDYYNFPNSPECANGAAPAPSQLEVTGISAASVEEGGQLVYTVSLNQAALAGETINIKLPLASSAAGQAVAADIDAGAVVVSGASPSPLNLGDKAYHAVTVATGASSFQVKVATVDDAALEPDEQLTLMAKGANNEQSGTGTITASDQLATLKVTAVSAPTASEGGNLVYTVTLNRAAVAGDVAGVKLPFTSMGAGYAVMADLDAKAATLTDATDAGSGGSSTDLSSNQYYDQLNLSPGKSSFQVTIKTIDDSTQEQAETVELAAIAYSGDQTPVSGTGTIGANDQPAPLKVTAISAPTASEGGDLAYSVTLNRAAVAGDVVGIKLPFADTGAGYATRADVNAQSVRLTDATDGGTGSSTVDLSSAQYYEQLKVTAGRSSFVVTVTTLDDSTQESAEALTLTAVAVGGDETVASGTGTISANDQPAPLKVTAISAPTASEGGDLVYTVTLSRAVVASDVVGIKLPFADTGAGYATRADVNAQSVRLSDATDGGTGSSTVDLSSAQYYEQLKVTAGRSSFVVTVTTLDDSTQEPAEALTLTAVAVGGDETVASGTGTISANDQPGPIKVTAVSAPTASEGGDLVYTVTLSRAVVASDVLGIKLPFTNTGAGYAAKADVSAQSVRLTDATESGTGNGTVDLSSAQYYDQLKVTTGKSSFQVAVPTIDDSAEEPSETLELLAIGYSGDQTVASGIGTISDNDQPGPIKVTAVSALTASEGDDLVYTVTLNRAVVANDVLGIKLPFANTGAGYAAKADVNAQSVRLTDATESGTGNGTVDLNSNQYYDQLKVTTGKSSFQVTVPTIDDSEEEPSETLELLAIGYSGDQTVASGNGTISDNDQPGPLKVTAVSAPTASEGGDLAYTVSLNRAAVADDRVGIKLPFASTGASYAAKSDVNAQSVRLTDATDGGTGSNTVDLSSAQYYEQLKVTAGRSSFVVTVTTLDDSEQESTEALTLTAVAIVGDQTVASGNGTISDNDQPGPLKVTAVSTPSVFEGGDLAYSVTLNRAAVAGDRVGIKLPFASTGASYAARDDVNAQSVRLTDALLGNGSNIVDLSSAQYYEQLNVTAGKSSFVVTVTTLDDSTQESTEALTLTAVAIVGDQTVASGNGTISDNDTVATEPLTVTALQSSVSTSEGNYIFLQFTLNRNPLPGERLVLSSESMISSPGFSFGTDVKQPFYVGSGTQWSAGNSSTVSPILFSDLSLLEQGSNILRIDVATDTLVEGTESMHISLYGEQQTTTRLNALASIQDVVAAGLEITAISAPTVVEGGNLAYTVSLSRPYASGDEVKLGLGQSGTATAADVSANQATLGSGASGSLDLSGGAQPSVPVTPGATSFTLTLPTLDDSEQEPEETVILDAYATGSGWFPTGGLGRIQDNDDAPLLVSTVQANPTAVDEGAGFMTYDVTLNRAVVAGEEVELSLPLPLGSDQVSADDLQLAAVSWSDDAGGAETIDLSGDARVKVAPSAGMTSLHVKVPLVDDLLDEADEQATLAAQAMDPAPVTGTGTILDNDNSVYFSVTPVGNIEFVYDLAQGSFGTESAAFNMVISGIGGTSGLKVEAQRGSLYQLTQTNNAYDRSIDVELLAGEEVLGPDTWTVLLGEGVSYPGLEGITTQTDEEQTANASFMARLTNFFDGNEFIADDYMPDGFYSGQVSADFRVVWEP